MIGAGVSVLMVPMFRDADELARVADAVAGRAHVVGLLETREAAEQVERVAAVEGVDELHVGLNDLTLALGFPHRFALLASDELARVADAVVAAGRRLGVGGIGRADDRALPLDPDLVYAQLARLGATSTLLSRVFVRSGPDRMGRLAADVARARSRMDAWRAAGAPELAAARRELAARAASLPGW